MKSAWLSGAVALICAAGCAEEAAAPAADTLPAYPRRTLVALRDALGLGHEGGERAPDAGAPFVATGTVARDAQGFLLMEDTAICCTSITVGFRVDAAAPDEGKRVAVFGRVARAGDDAPGTRLWLSPSGFRLLVQGYVIEPERIVPAERLVKRHNVVDLMTSDSISIFARALRETGLGDVLRSAEAVTILVPVDEAFAGREELFEPRNREQLRLLVLRHVIPAKLRERDLMARDSVTVLTREELPVRVENGSLRIGGARTLFEDASGANGVLHLINTVLQ